MSDICRGTGRSNYRTLTQLLGEQLGGIRHAFAQRRALRELEAVPYEIRKDTGWRSDL